MTKLETADLPEPRFLISDLCKLAESYLTPEQVAELYRAYMVGAEAHDGQMRRSGEPYISHPLSVAGILAHMRMDAPTLIAALLHDVIEDTDLTKEQVASTFGEQVAELVDGVSKLRNMNFANKAEAQAASFHKMIMAMTRDIRVILLKLADRLHNMRTIKYMKPESRRRKCRETLEIYAPIATRLSISKFGDELEELGFAGLHPWRHRVIKKHLEDNLRRHHELFNKIQATIEHRLEQQGIQAKIELYQKSTYSLYKKMPTKQHNAKQLFKDTFGFRIIVADVDTCYRVLGAVHSLYKPKPGNFKDYIAIPRSNHYQSLHTRLFGYKGLKSIDIRIRTHDMQQFAEYGISAQGLYQYHGEKKPDCTHNWLRTLLDLRESSINSVEFLEHVKLDLFPDEVYVFTPKGDIIELPRGATVVDFAYAIHSDIGDKLNAAKIDDRMMAPLNTQLHSGQVVEVFTANWTSPKPEWLDFAITGRARSHIRRFLKSLNQEQAVRLGQRIFDRELERYSLSVEKLNPQQCRSLLDKFNFDSMDDLLADIGLGNHLAYLVARHLSESLPTTTLPQPVADSEQPSNTPLVIKGTEGMVVSLAKCCHPIPGDAIKGYVSPGRGIVVHTQQCKNMTAYRSPSNWLELSWAEQLDTEFLVVLRVEVKNEKGVLGKVSTVIGDLGINIEDVSSDPRNGVSSNIDFSVRVKDRRHLAQLIRALRQQIVVKRTSRKN